MRSSDFQREVAIETLVKSKLRWCNIQSGSSWRFVKLVADWWFYQNTLERLYFSPGSVTPPDLQEEPLKTLLKGEHLDQRAENGWMLLVIK